MRTSIPSLSPQLEDLLRNSAISEDAPGPVLHDFELILDFVDAESPSLTETHLLSLRDLTPLNQKLHRRLDLGLTRPVQKSFPHINGLFLLLRASGLTLLDVSGRKPRLVTDATALQSWRSLNPDERYFHLLESWLMRGDAGIVGERLGSFNTTIPFLVWAEFHDRLLRNSWHDDDWIERVKYRPAILNLALMELFGLVDIDDGPVVDKKGWQIRDVRGTRWGEALLAALWSDLGEDFDIWIQLDQPYLVHPGTLLPFIQPYRPEWRRPLDLPLAEFQPGLYVFKVSLTGDVWRQIFIRDIATLDDLSTAILYAFDFDQDHLYRFVYATRFGFEAEFVHPEMDDGLSAEDVRVGDLPAKPGFHMIYNYDFGDDWLFDVSLERIEPLHPGPGLYRIGDRQGESPEQYPNWEECDFTA